MGTTGGALAKIVAVVVVTVVGTPCAVDTVTDDTVIYTVELNVEYLTTGVSLGNCPSTRFFSWLGFHTLSLIG